MTLNSYISSLIAKVHSFHLLNLKFIFIGMKHIAAVAGGAGSYHRGGQWKMHFI